MTARAKFKQADIERAVRGVLAAGLSVRSVEITPEGIAVNVGAPAAAVRPNPLDRLLGPHPSKAVLQDPGAAARETASMLKRMPRK